MHQTEQELLLTATPEDIEAITEASRDYVEGWYNAQPERMARCLHPDLVKRTIAREPGDGPWQLRPPTNAQMMVQYTEEGGGSEVPEPERTYEITILDVFRHIASVKVLSHDYMDYLQLAKFDQEWLLVNVLWELREGELTTDS